MSQPYLNIKEKIKDCLQALPEYESPDGEVYTNIKYELIESRMEKKNNREIGPINLAVAFALLNQLCMSDPEFFSYLRKIPEGKTLLNYQEAKLLLFEQILKDLEKEKIIRELPSLQRKKLRVV